MGDEGITLSENVDFDRILKDFRYFLKPMFSNPGAVFDSLSQGGACVEPVDFKNALKKMGFKDDASLLWLALCEGHKDRPYLSRDAFVKVMVYSKKEKKTEEKKNDGSVPKRNSMKGLKRSGSTS